MPSGIMEVLLADARGLRSTDILDKMDPYVLIQYRSQERKSSVARGQGSNPVWNERFNFRVDYPGASDEYKLTLKIMDHDTFSQDDFVGQATIYLQDVLALGVENGKGELKPAKYRVTLSDLTYCGDIQVGITFTPKVEDVTDRDFDFGGWKQSS